MSAGLQIINDYNTVIIDENFPNLLKRYSGTATSDANGNLSLTFACEVPLMAIYSTQFISQKYCSVSGGNRTFYFKTVPNHTIEYYLFDLCKYGPTTGVGLQVFNAAGERVFDSSPSSAIPYGLISKTINSSGVSSYVGSFAIGSDGTRKMAIVTCQPAGYCVSIAPDFAGFTVNDYRLGFKHTSSNVIATQHVIVDVITGTPYPPPTVVGGAGPNGLFLAVDVTALG